MGNRHLLCALSAALLLAAVPAGAAKHKTTAAPPPAHNLVDLDLTPSVPAPAAPPHLRLSASLIDSASVTHAADTVSFDTVEIWKSTSHYMTGMKETGPPEGTVVYYTQRYQVSCKWWTIRRLPEPAQDYVPGKPFQPVAITIDTMQDEFITPQSRYVTLIDRACSGGPLNAGKGFASVDAALAAWTDKFSTMPTTSRLAPPALMRYAGPPPDPWMDGAAPHQFKAVATDPANGNVLFLDTANIVREGQSTTALSFALLGPQTQHFDRMRGSVAALRKARYDCAARTMTVVAQANWDTNARFIGQSQTVFPPRAAGAGMDIDAVCSSNPSPDGPIYASVETAWDATLAGWPPSPLEAWLPCLWDHVPADKRQGYIAQWKATDIDQFVMVKWDERPALAAACNIPEPSSAAAFSKLGLYADQRAVLQILTAAKLDDAAIMAAWRAKPRADRRHYLELTNNVTTENFPSQQAFENRFADALHVRSYNTDARTALARYTRAQAWIEGN